MKSFTFKEYGRIITTHLGRGELLLESINRELERLHVRNAVVLSCIGTLRRARYHVITRLEDPPVDEVLTRKGPIEVSCIQGIVLNGEPHLHIVLSDPEGCYTGHLEDGCEVQNLMEIMFMEIPDMDIIRRKNEHGIVYLDRPD
ncbi:MAG: DNA-binding protein [Planctomycetota bacterium]|jgi:predicted DNA-binding protein with PD1-like motif|nr:DNA-binding protein [Planctomycetota bacterium]